MADGTPLVLVHGSPGNPQSWNGVRAALPDRFEVLTPTLAGYEAAVPPADPDPAETSDLAAALAAEISACAMPPLLAAHSYGANVALHVASAGVPLAGLALFEPVAFRLLPPLGHDDAYARATGAFERYFAAFEAGAPEAVGVMVDLLFGDGAFAQMPEPVQAYLKANTAMNVRDVKATFRETYDPDALAALELPVSVAHGDRSPSALRVLSEAIADAVPNGRSQIIEGANHAMLATHPDAVAGLIAEAAGV